MQPPQDDTDIVGSATFAVDQILHLTPRSPTLASPVRVRLLPHAVRASLYIVGFRIR